MSGRLLAALRREPLDRPPLWIMRQAGRYLPEYRELRRRYSFQEAVATPAVAAEITMQPLRRFSLDGAVVFADIMTPLEAMGVEMTFDPGPRLEPLGLREVARLGPLAIDRVGFVAETIGRVRAGLSSDVAVIGFAGGPLTLLAYLVEGGGSKDFMKLRGELRKDPELSRHALLVLAEAMNTYLRAQVEAGADVVQLFDTWSGLLDKEAYADLVVPAARSALSGLTVPTIYFAPGAGHTLALQPAIGATAYGVDWRTSISAAWDQLGEVAVQGNLDPAVLLASHDAIKEATTALLGEVGQKPGHIFNLGHGIDRATPVESVAYLADLVRGGGR